MCLVIGVVADNRLSDAACMDTHSQFTRKRCGRQEKEKVWVCDEKVQYWMCDGQWLVGEEEVDWGESGMRGGAGGLRRGLLFDGLGGCITCDVPEGEIEVLG